MGDRHISEHEREWDDEYLPHLPRPRFRSPDRHLSEMRRQVQESPGSSLSSLLSYDHFAEDLSTPRKAPRPKPLVHVLNIGHSKMDENGCMNANCTVTLIEGCKFNILVDTMTAWDGEILTQHLESFKLRPSDINYVVCTHGHADHIGCNYLFQDAHHVVGTSISYKEKYFMSPLDDGKEFMIEPKVKVVCTPGHTEDSVSVLVQAANLGLVAITGDLFEREADIEFPALWRETAGSKDPESQEKNRKMILDIADYIVPGHGPMFQNIYKGQ